MSMYYLNGAEDGQVEELKERTESLPPAVAKEVKPFQKAVISLLQSINNVVPPDRVVAWESPRTDVPYFWPTRPNALSQKVQLAPGSMQQTFPYSGDYDWALSTLTLPPWWRVTVHDVFAEPSNCKEGWTTTKCQAVWGPVERTWETTSKARTIAHRVLWPETVLKRYRSAGFWGGWNMLHQSDAQKAWTKVHVIPLIFRVENLWPARYDVQRQDYEAEIATLQGNLEDRMMLWRQYLATAEAKAAAVRRKGEVEGATGKTVSEIEEEIVAGDVRSFLQEIESEEGALTAIKEEIVGAAAMARPTTGTGKLLLYGGLGLGAVALIAFLKREKGE